MLKPRLITAALLAAFFGYALVFLSLFIFAQILIFVILVAGWEWTDLAAFKTRFSKYGFLLALGICMVATGYHVDFHNQLDLLASYNICVLVLPSGQLFFFGCRVFPLAQFFGHPSQ